MKAKVRRYWWLVVALLAGANVYVRSGRTDASFSGPPDLNLFPLRMGLWDCIPEAPAYADNDPTASKVWVGRCRKEDGAAIQIYVAFSNHSGTAWKLPSPLLNYPEKGGGWSFLSKDSVSIGKESPSESGLSLNQSLLLHRSGEKVAMAYWYQIGGRTYASDYRYRVNVIVRRILKMPVTSQLVRLTMPVSVLSPDGAFALEKELARTFMEVSLKSFQ